MTVQARLDQIRARMISAQDWHNDMPGSDWDTPLGEWMHTSSPALIAVAEAAQLAFQAVLVSACDTDICQAPDGCQGAAARCVRLRAIEALGPALAGLGGEEK